MTAYTPDDIYNGILENRIDVGKKCPLPGGYHGDIYFPTEWAAIKVYSGRFYNKKFHSVKDVAENEFMVGNALRRIGFNVPIMYFLIGADKSRCISNPELRGRWILGMERLHGKSIHSLSPTEWTHTRKKYGADMRRVKMLGFYPHHDSISNTIYDENTRRLFYIDFSEWCMRADRNLFESFFHRKK